MNFHRHTVLAIAVVLSGCDAPSGTGNETTTTSTAASAPVALGKVGKANGIELTVTKIEQRSQIGASVAALKAAPSEIYVVARYTIKNVGSEPLAFTARPELSLVDAKGQDYSVDLPAAAMAGNSLEELTDGVADLNPNTSAKGVAVWKVEKAAFDKGTWKLGLSSDPQITFALK